MVLVVLVATGVILALQAAGHGTEGWPIWVTALAATSGVGVLLALRRPGNPIGWLLLANGIVLVASGLAEAYARYALDTGFDEAPGAAWAVLYNEVAWPTLFVAVTAVALLFPDGRLPSPRWRPLAWVAGLSAATVVVQNAFTVTEFAAPYERVANPLPTADAPLLTVLGGLAFLGLLAGLIGAALAVRVRLRRSHGEERLQIKWLAYAVAVIPLSVGVCLTEIAVTGDDGAATALALGGALTAIPVSIGIAVMRYRLYEIDRLINRTLVYVTLTAGLAALFAAVAVFGGVVLGAGSTLPTAAGTLAVAVGFGPLRRRAQVLIDRRFDRARYHALRRVGAFLTELRAGRAAPESVGQVMAEALHDPRLELLFRFPEDKGYVDVSGRDVDPLPADERAVTPVRHGPADLGVVLHDRALGDQPDLLDSVIEAAGLAIEIARLRVEVRRRLAEVEDSRARIVTAGYEERRRLERDLHDGAQQRLVSIGLALRHVEAALPDGSREAAGLNDAVDEVGSAIRELRELARGVRPAGLDEGLGAALTQLVARSPVRTRIDITPERFDDRIETAAYFVASEALANAAKYAHATEVAVRAERQNGTLVVCVRDDGVGGARPASGSGLAGMTDRVAALGGRLDVDSPPGSGTVVTAELPCAS